MRLVAERTPGIADWQLRHEAEGVAAGETFGAELVVPEPADTRSISVSLSFVDESDAHLNAVRHDGPVRLHDGPVEPGIFPFELTFPSNALPNYRSERGSLYWACAVDVEVTVGDKLARRAALYQVDPDPGTYRALSAPSIGTDEDLVVAPLAGSVRRGERIRADVLVGEPSPGRKLACGLACTVAYTQMRTNGSAESAGHGHETVTEPVFDRWVDIDASSASPQCLDFVIPRQAPFSYEGNAVSFAWTLMVAERRSMRPDVVATARIQVLP